MTYTFSMNRNISSEAIVLSSRAYSEADKMVTIYTQNYGKITVIAKGVKRLKSRKRGALEAFSKIRFSAHSGHGMPIMTEADIVDGFSDIRSDLKRVSVAYYFLEATLRTTQDEEPNDKIYRLLDEFLKRLKKEQKLKKLRGEFTIRLAETLGFIPTGEFVPDADKLLESITERKMGSVRVGKRLQL